MIGYEEFERISNEVKQAVVESFDYLKNKTNSYILYLANGEYKMELKHSHLRLNPYIIDSREERYKDKDRRAFYVEFLKTFYTFINRQATDDNTNRIHMELMVYSHIWESKPYLKQLWRLAILIDMKSYPWELTIPDMSKHETIRNDIRNTFQRRGLSVSVVISSGFHTSLRNAFAHSEYYFNESTKHIMLDTYTGKSWDIPNISYDEWSQKFAYSILLCYYFQNEIFIRRESLISEFKTNTFLIMHPLNCNTTRANYVTYDQRHDTFNFTRNIE